MKGLFLGLDASTQGMEAVLIDLAAGRVVYRRELTYAQRMPHYHVTQGFCRGADGLSVYAPPLMFAEALDLIFSDMKDEGVDLAKVCAVSGSGQQHGSVYLNASAHTVLTRLDPGRPLAQQIEGIFSRSIAPIWMDSSTHQECEEITLAMGGADRVAEATGSCVFERFTAPQIRKFYKTDRAAYEQTAHICLISSFLASLLAGRVTPIDHGDGSGMNLMDIRAKTWRTDALDATAPGLSDKLLPPVAPWTVTGPVSSYFARRYGLNPQASHVVWSGDNPCSLIGLGLIEPGMAAVSLGTSDTFFGVMSECHVDPDGEGHVFVAPTGDYMSLICFKNGSLAREKIRNQFFLDWDGFAAAIESTPTGNRGRVMLPYFEPEIVPRVLTPGVQRFFGLDEDDAGANCRAVVEAQMMAMRLHSRWMGVEPTRIFATGGASANSAILKIMANVLRAPVCAVKNIDNSAALGAALRAVHAHRMATLGTASWNEIISRFHLGATHVEISPDTSAFPEYGQLSLKYIECEMARTGRKPRGHWAP